MLLSMASSSACNADAIAVSPIFFTGCLHPIIDPANNIAAAGMQQITVFKKFIMRRTIFCRQVYNNNENRKKVSYKSYYKINLTTLFITKLNSIYSVIGNG